MTNKPLRGLLFYLSIVLIFVGTSGSAAPDFQKRRAVAKEGAAASGRVELAQVPQSPRKPSPEPEFFTITRLTAEEGKDGVAVTVESSGNLQYTAFRLHNPLRLVMDIPKTRMGVFQDPMTVNKGVVESVRPLFFDEAQVLRLEIALKQPTAYEIVRSANNKVQVNLKEAPAMAAVPSPAVPAPAAEAKPVPAEAAKATPAKTGEPEQSMTMFTEEQCYKLLAGSKEPISMDFQNAQLTNIFRILSEVSGFNLVLSPSVQGTVNARLLDVPWNQAMELILKNNNLSRQCFEKIVRIVTVKEVAAEEEDRRAAKERKQKANREALLAGELETEMITINYADITGPNKNIPNPDNSELVKALKAVKSERGQISVNPRTNTLILSDVRPRLNEMINVIKRVDHPTPQVLIEARIVEVNRDIAQNLGIQWGSSGTFVTAKDFPSTVKFGSSTATNKGFLVDLAQAEKILPNSGAGIGLSLGSLAKDVVLDIQLTALETEGKLRILSSPKVTTMDNREARIQSGRKIPYATVSQDGTKIEFVDATIELLVTPHITDDKTILMNIQAKKNSADFSKTVQGVPTILTKEARTELLIRDGDTTVLGGLYENTVSQNDKRVPFLHKMPLLGNLFKAFIKQDIVDELLIFITPSVVKNLQGPS
ncbi:MAG: type IV pilus secretin PilQ [Nitrospinae bacterium]|nr:type IV pilus secretin PilQ [Nitrospinota bacterium]